MSAPDTTDRALASLVVNFVASKKALATTEYVYRANDLVSWAREHLEYLATNRIAIQRSSQTSSQAIISLKAILHGLKAVAHSSNNDFENILQKVDDADARVTRLKTSLQNTFVDPALRPKGESSRSLHDFIDTGSTDQLHEQVKESIDHIHEAQDDYDAVLNSFEAKVDDLCRPSSITEDASTSMSPVVQAYHSLETHASEMAGLLQSLVRHYDLCITALKHTEGGGQAVQQASAELRKDFEQQTSAPSEHISDGERQEMLHVIENDAAEVDDVVHEITERLADMESQFTIVTNEVDNLKMAMEHVEQVKSQLVNTQAIIDDAIQGSERYANRWRELCVRLQEQVEEFQSQHRFYANFVRAYDGLLVEIGRRKLVEADRQQIVHRATAKLDRLLQEDARGREEFRAEFGEYLPSDIWSGLSEEQQTSRAWPPAGEDESLPSIDATALSKARQRLLK